MAYGQSSSNSVPCGNAGLSRCPGVNSENSPASIRGSPSSSRRGRVGSLTCAEVARSTASPIAASRASVTLRPTPPAALSQGRSTARGAPKWAIALMSAIDNEARCGCNTSPWRFPTACPIRKELKVPAGEARPARSCVSLLMGSSAT